MARTTEAAVLLIMGSPATLTTSDITPYLVPANYMVTNNLASYITDDDDLLEMIERFLAAHFVSLAKEKEVKSEGVAGITQSYGGQFGKGLEYTSYGQNAMLLDTTGRLTQLNKGKLKSVSIGILMDVGEDRNYPNV